jgi:hypothetical protein
MEHREFIILRIRDLILAYVLSVFTRVCTNVQRGSKFCFVVVVLGADTLIRILHFRPISPCFQHITPLNAALPGSLAVA